MTSDLPVALRLRGAFLQIHALEHGVLAKAPAGGENRLLAVAFLGEKPFLLCRCVVKLLVIDEQAELPLLP